MGSKARHADEILKIVLAKRKPGQTYVEPFVGGANVLCRVPAEQGPRIGADINSYMIALHTALANGWEPPATISEVEYRRIKRDPSNYAPELVAFAGTGVTFGSKWFDSYVKEGDRCRQSRDTCLRDAPGLRGATFIHATYDTLVIPPESLIYCDPPYVGTACYDGMKTNIIKADESLNKNIWKTAPFWRWCDRMTDEGHTVFVSEYTAPPLLDVKPPQDLQDERDLLAVRLRKLQADESASSADIQLVYDGVMMLDTRIAEYKRQHGASPWKVMWEKEVTSDFSTTRGDKAKVEVEKLFHRER